MDSYCYSFCCTLFLPQSKSIDYMCESDKCYSRSSGINVCFIGERGYTGDSGLPGPPGPSVGGAVYTRWGRTTCPNITGTQLVYAGRAVGSHSSHKGGGANYLCLPNDPSYLQYTSGHQSERDHIYGSEYQTSNGPLSAFNNHNVPCAVCYVSTRGTVLMIPAKTTCPSSWTLEYNGYLMSGH